MKKENLLVIADDLTGANDTGVMFSEAGFETKLEVNLTSLDMVDFFEYRCFFSFD
ncbi:four-carbon acid sugar kinase family protein [Actinobacillus seminis]|uniref:four-carbon acid sugar kinase family protein n=1 Tax=Actinobacillus seminis TaxID=722 RepID=UPI003B940D8B